MSIDRRFKVTLDLTKQLDSEPELKFSDDTPRLSSFVRDRVMHSLRDGATDVESSIQSSLEGAIADVLPSLRGGAVEFLNHRGGSKNRIMYVKKFGFARPQLTYGLTMTPIWVSNVEWMAVDLGDTIPLLGNDRLFDVYGKSSAGKICGRSSIWPPRWWNTSRINRL